MTEQLNLEVFSPGDYIREELEERGWTQADLAAILGRPVAAMSEVIVGRRSVTPETAHGLAAAFGTSAQLWLNLEAAFRLAQSQSTAKDDITLRAKIYSSAPVKEMQRRGWIGVSKNPDVLEAQILKFYGIASLEERPVLSHVARKSTEYSKSTNEQLAWLCRARHLAESSPTQGRFTKKSLGKALADLNHLKLEAEGIRHIPRVLSEAGIRFLVVEHLQRTKIDGACLWLSRSSPVVALSMRYDRIDWFWFTLMHELAHVENRDGLDMPQLDSCLVGEGALESSQKPDVEREADQRAASLLLDQKQLDNFIARVHPLYSHVKIRGFAKRIGVHPGIVVGQLQRRDKISYAHSRKMLVKVRNIVTASVLTDGWGHIPQV